MHISTMSSSVTEVTLNRMPSFLVNINMHILVLSWGLSDRHFWFGTKGHNDAFLFILSARESSKLSQISANDTIKKLALPIILNTTSTTYLFLKINNAARY